MVATCINGFCSLAQYSVAFEMSVHITRKYDAGEATACGVINMVSNLIAFIMILGLTPLLNNEEPIDVIITSSLFFGVLVIAFLLMICVKSVKE